MKKKLPDHTHSCSNTRAQEAKGKPASCKSCNIVKGKWKFCQMCVEAKRRLSK